MTVLTLVAISFILEILEVFTQYSGTLKASVLKMYKLYHKNIFLFFASQFGYIWILFISLAYDNLSFPIIIAIALKTFDIFTKLELIKKLFMKPDLNYIAAIAQMIDNKIPFWVYLVGPLTYPYLIYIAFTE